MKTNAEGKALITQFEGCKLTAYVCPAGVLTIGVGHTSAAGAPRVTAGMRITQADADRILASDLAQFERAVNSAVRVPLTANQFSALVSLAFNIGAGALANSTLVRLLNAGDTAGAAQQFTRWNKSGGRVLRGLTRRREAERALFLKP